MEAGVAAAVGEVFAESEKWSNLPRNRLRQIQTFLTITVIFGQNRHDFECLNLQRRRKGGCFVHSENIRVGGVCV